MMSASEEKTDEEDAPKSTPRPKTGNARKGFASLSPEQRKEAARRGGKAAHESGRAHKWTVKEAQEAGRLGGEATARKRGKEYMRDIGTRGRHTKE